MSDQDEGFTFTDKRRVAEDSPATDESPVTEEATEPVTAAEPGSDDVPVADTEDDIDDVGGEEFGIGSTNQVALYALGLLQMNALQQLGLMADPKSGKSQRDLAQARVAIDCVAGLINALDAPGSVLEPHLRQEMRRMITDLRLNFVTQQQLAATENK